MRKRLTVRESYDVLWPRRRDSFWTTNPSPASAIEAVEQNGIVFLDEIDKVARGSENRGGDVSREGVQRDLLPP